MTRPVARVGVCADDVTGSNDIGSMYVNVGLTAQVFPWNSAAYPPCDVTIVDTDSRFIDPAEAYRRVFEVTKRLKEDGCTHFFKKTCSVFRGNVGVEFDAMLDALGEPFAAVVLGFPANGRTTRHGMHTVYGQRLEESPFAKDPMNPMTRSDLVGILSAQTKRPVSLIEETVLDQGEEALREALFNAQQRGGYCLFDVRDDADLETIASVVWDLPVLAGASAIAGPVGRYFCGSATPVDTASIPDPKKGILVSVGSLMPASRNQAQYAKDHGFACYSLVADQETSIGALAREIADQLEAGQDVALKTPGEPEAVARIKQWGAAQGWGAEETSRFVSEQLAECTVQALALASQRRVVIAGGDTSGSFCTRMGIEGMYVHHEIQPGLPSCVTLGEAPLWVVLKSGSFGSDDFFVRAVEHLRG